MIKRLLLALTSLLFLSCEKDIDFDLWKEIKIQPNGTIPLVNARLTLADLVTDGDTLLQIDPDDALRIYYRQDSIFSYGANKLVRIPDQDPEQITLSRVLPIVQVGKNLGTLGGAEIDSAEFFKGFLEYSIVSSAPVSNPIDIQFTLFNTDDGGTPFSRTITLAANETTALDSASVAQLFFDFTAGGTRTNFLDVQLAIQNISDLPSGVDLDVIFRLKSLEVQRAVGFFGEGAVVAPPGDFDLGISGLENFAGGFFLSNPTVTLTTISSAGLPVEVRSTFTGLNSAGSGVPLAPPNLVINAAPDVNTPTLSPFSVDNDNSNIVNFLANIPNQVFYRAQASLNPGGRPSTPNFVSRNSKVSVNFELDISLELRLEQMTLDETIEDVQIGSVESPDFIEELTLFVRSENAIPVTMNMQVSFLDSTTGDSIGGVFLDFLQAAPVDANGQSNGTSVTESEIVLNDEQITALLKSNAIRFRAAVNTLNGGSERVKLYATDGLEVRMATKVRLNVNPESL